jgi:beta-galactosidase/beta-glucuronidase
VLSTLGALILVSWGVLAAHPPDPPSLRGSESRSARRLDGAPDVPRAEHPRPDRGRADWQTLNGTWEFDFDPEDRGLAEGWFRGTRALSRTIVVPYCPESRLSGIGDTSPHEVVWYRRRIAVPEAWRSRRLWLHFGAVDYEARVWVNGDEVGRHRGGQTPFGFDVTDHLKAGDNVVVVRAWDGWNDRTLPRGKQYWKPRSESIFYTRTTGIWQPVWMEAVDPVHVETLRITPDVDRSQVVIEARLSKPAPDARLRATVTLDGAAVAESDTRVGDRDAAVTLRLPGQRLWSPERPILYDVALEVTAGGKTVDTLKSYFGQRKVSTHAGKVYLNDAPYYLKLVLDQGYWPESILTPPTDEAMQRDIQMAKSFGLNGARKHQKVEDPRWLYWCDKLGFIVWGEMANAYEYSDVYVSRMLEEWPQAVARDYNHPSIIAWVPINESWGVPRVLTDRVQQAHLKSLYELTRSLDSTRLVVDNDGWEHTDATDLMTLHDYARTGVELAAKYQGVGEPGRPIPRNGREALVYGVAYNGTPLLMTEFGGIAFRLGAPTAANEWGYSGIEPTAEAFVTRLDGLVKAITANPAFAGYCYTQLTDVEQEINGLMTYDRKPKVEPQQYKRVFAPER